MSAEIGVIGLGVMGSSIAKNLLRNSFQTAVYNRSEDKLKTFLSEVENSSHFVGTSDLKQFINGLTLPRKILLMVSAGSAVDELVDTLTPLLQEGDIIIDGGNSHFIDTERRIKRLQSRGISFIGMGISGGERGALLGPSMMPGGDRSAMESIMPILETISAKAPTPCVSFVGNGGAGHFVKMVHNGIEYAEMQFISEVYSFAREVLGLSREKLVDLFEKLNHGQLESYLLEITHKILQTEDPLSSRHLLEMISDRAKGKGTGRWTVESSLQLGVPFPTAYAAVDARNLSSLSETREMVRNLYSEKVGTLKVAEYEDCLCKAMIAGKLIIYSQGISLIEMASREYKFSINISSLLESWRGGCIIRSTLLDSLSKSVMEKGDGLFITHLPFVSTIKEGMSELRRLGTTSISHGVPSPCILSMITYYDALRSEKLGTSLIQAQRDFFGSHTYERVDREGTFHTEWESS